MKGVLQKKYLLAIRKQISEFLENSKIEFFQSIHLIWVIGWLKKQFVLNKMYLTKIVDLGKLHKSIYLL